MKQLILFVFCFFQSCTTEKNPEEAVIARVGDEKLTKESLLFLAGKREGDIDFYSRTTNRWVENKLLYRAALSIGLDKDLVLTKERDLFYENLLISSFIKIETKKRSKTTKKEVSDYYLKNKDSFKRIDDEVLVKHFVFSTKKEAKKIKEELKRKNTKFDMEELLNKQRVETKTIRKKEGGSSLVGFIFTGVVGDVLGPKKHGENFHLFQIIQKHKEGSYLGLERVYEEIYQRIYKEKEALVLDRVLDSLYLNSDVFVSKEFLIK